MKLSNLKSVLKIASFGLLMTLVIPSNIYAQNKQHKTESKKVKVIQPRYNNNRPAQPRNTRVTKVPANSRLINYRNANYYYNNGAYYLSRDGAYIVTRPPLGIRISVLPPNHFAFKNRGHNYYYHNGIYYTPTSNNNYEVVSAPVGSLIEVLPDGYDVVELEGNVYYRFNDTYYKAIQEPNGYILYEVVAI